MTMDEAAAMIVHEDAPGHLAEELKRSPLTMVMLSELMSDHREEITVELAGDLVLLFLVGVRFGQRMVESVGKA
jgi:hypothetical protein